MRRYVKTKIAHKIYPAEWLKVCAKNNNKIIKTKLNPKS
jgi:hypothetical protein